MKTFTMASPFDGRRKTSSLKADLPRWIVLEQFGEGSGPWQFICVSVFLNDFHFPQIGVNSPESPCNPRAGGAEPQLPGGLFDYRVGGTDFKRLSSGARSSHLRGPLSLRRSQVCTVLKVLVGNLSYDEGGMAAFGFGPCWTSARGRHLLALHRLNR